MTVFQSARLFALVLALTGGPAFAATADDSAANEDVVAATRKPALPTEAELARARAEQDARPVIKPISTEQQIADWVANAPKVERDTDMDGKRKMHGEFGVSVGTGGYRSAYVSTLIPIGETGTLGIAVSQTDFGKNYVPYGGYYSPYGGLGGYGYGGYGYGYGGYGYGRGLGIAAPRGGSSQSVSVLLDMSGTKEAEASDCVTGFRDGDRFVEPLWLSKLRGPKSC